MRPPANYSCHLQEPGVFVTNHVVYLKNRGRMLLELPSRSADAQRDFTRALELLATPVMEHDASRQLGQAALHGCLADTYQALQQPAAALSNLTSAIQIYLALAATDTFTHASNLVQALEQRGDCYRDLKNAEATELARADFAQAILFCHRLPGTDYAATLHQRLAECLTDLRRLPEAYTNYQIAIGLLVPAQHREQFALLLNARGVFLAEQYTNLPNAKELARQSYDNAITQFENLPNARALEARTNLASTVRNRGLVLSLLEEFVAAEQDYKRALGLSQAGKNQQLTTTLLTDLGTLLMKWPSRQSEARGFLQEALQAGEKLQAQNPVRGMLAQAKAQIALGQLCLPQGNPGSRQVRLKQLQAAENELNLAITLLDDKLPKAVPDDAVKEHGQVLSERIALSDSLKYEKRSLPLPSPPR